MEDQFLKNTWAQHILRAQKQSNRTPTGWTMVANEKFTLLWLAGSIMFLPGVGSSGLFTSREELSLHVSGATPVVVVNGPCRDLAMDL